MRVATQAELLGAFVASNETDRASVRIVARFAIHVSLAHRVVRGVLELRLDVLVTSIAGFRSGALRVNFRIGRAHDRVDLVTVRALDSVERVAAAVPVDHDPGQFLPKQSNLINNRFTRWCQVVPMTL